MERQQVSFDMISEGSQGSVILLYPFELIGNIYGEHNNSVEDEKDKLDFNYKEMAGDKIMMAIFFPSFNMDCKLRAQIVKMVAQYVMTTRFDIIKRYTDGLCKKSNAALKEDRKRYGDAYVIDIL